ncbi:MAG: hypothetical protein RBS68_08145 [Anaerolineales bacterium]|jgi:hypothetical protein|nr:hypothetical protein [Anaerolineales bacterium]
MNIKLALARPWPFLGKNLLNGHSRQERTGFKTQLRPASSRASMRFAKPWVKALPAQYPNTRRLKDLGRDYTGKMQFF